MIGRRLHSGALNTLEAPLISYLAPRIPPSVEPDHLSALALAGAGLAGISLAACGISAWFLPSALLGLLLNWFGDSLDGAVARFRRRERPRVGFLIDRCADTSSFCVIIFGLGLSPYLSFHAALMLLVAYLINSIYGLMKLVVDGVHVIGVGGVGATEGRLVIGLWAIFFQFTHMNLSVPLIRNIPAFDVACAAALSLMLAIFVWRVGKDVERQKYFERGWKGEEETQFAKSKIVPIGRRSKLAQWAVTGDEDIGAAELKVRSPEASS